MDIFEQVKKILCDQLDLDEEQVTEESEVIDDLGADSLDIVDLVMTLEEEKELIEQEIYVQGVVTSSDESGQYAQSIVFQDESGAINIYADLSSSNTSLSEVETPGIILAVGSPEYLALTLFAPSFI